MLTGVFYDFNRATDGELYSYSGIYTQGKKDLKTATRIKKSGAVNPTNSPDSYGQFAYIMRELAKGRSNHLKPYYKYPYTVAAPHFYLAPINFESLNEELNGAHNAKSSSSDIISSNNNKKATAKGSGNVEQLNNSYIGVFKGRVIAPRSMTFRFFGIGDDTILVRFNDKLVLESGYVRTTLYDGDGKNSKKSHTESFWQYYQDMAAGKIKEKQDYLILQLKSAPLCNIAFGGLIGGHPITVEKGKAYPIEVIIGNISAHAWYYLLTQEVTDGNDAPLHLFRTNTDEPTRPLSFHQFDRRKHGTVFFKEDGVAYTTDSMVWKIAGKSSKDKKQKNKFRKIN